LLDAQTSAACKNGTPLRPAWLAHACEAANAIHALVKSRRVCCFSAKGPVRGLYWIVRRADQLIRAQQEQLVDNETMGALGEMASAVAHGVRNPLSSIRSSAELWQNTPGAPCVESAADPRECRAVLQGLNNVVANALEAIPPQGGSVGIAPQNLEKIYQPFCRLKN
jgi:signal transduction histidine kinase